VSKLAEELLYTLQEGVGEEDGVPTTGLYCLVLVGAGGGLREGGRLFCRVD